MPRHRHLLAVLLCCAFTPLPAETPDAERGARLFADEDGPAHCIRCHGPQGRGKAAPNIQGASTEDIEFAIEQVSVMMPLDRLLPKDIADIAAYLGTLN